MRPASASYAPEQPPGPTEGLRGPLETGLPSCGQTMQVRVELGLSYPHMATSLHSLNLGLQAQASSHPPQLLSPLSVHLNLLPMGSLMSSLYSGVDILSSALSYIAGDFARRVLNGPGAPGPRRLETAPDKQPIGRCWAAEQGEGGSESTQATGRSTTLVGPLSSQEPSRPKFLFS